jgi:hypothetical protein
MKGATVFIVVSCSLLLAGVTVSLAQQMPVPGALGMNPAMPEQATSVALQKASGSEPAMVSAAVQGEVLDLPTLTDRVATGRDPFWPVGYAPVRREKPTASEMAGTATVMTDPGLAAKPVAWEQARAQLDMRGVSSIGRDKTTGKQRFVAVMAGKLIEEGNIVSIAYEGQVYRWRAVSVTATGVQLVKLDVREE